MTGHRSRCFAVLDVGGTWIKVGAVRGAEVVSRPAVAAHARADADTILGQLRRGVVDAVACAHELGGDRPDGLAIAFPGPFDFERSTPMLRDLGKFDSLYGVDLGRELSDALCPVFVRDSEAVGVGEAAFGAGNEHHRVLTCALGTGFGTCLTVDGRPQETVVGQVVEELHRLDTPHGSADDVLSATGLARLLGVSPTTLGELFSGPVLETAHAELVNEFANRLGSFLATLRLDPDLIVIAGGLAASFDLFHTTVARHLSAPIAAASLGASGALLGAVQLAFPNGSATK